MEFCGAEILPQQLALEIAHLPVTKFERCGIMSSGLQVCTEMHVFHAGAYMTALCMHKTKCACGYFLPDRTWEVIKVHIL